MSGIITARVPNHGEFRVKAEDLDWAIAHFLPASPKVLRSLWAEWTDAGDMDENEHPFTVSELLVMLTSIARGEADNPEADEPIPYHQLSRITQLTYAWESGPPDNPVKGTYRFVSGEGYDEFGHRVMITPPSNCQQIPRQGPASYLLRHWPDIREKVPEFFVRNALILEGG